jgi:WD40 repeat protein
MDSSDSLKIDEQLAQFLAAYDQSMEGGDGEAATLNVPHPRDAPPLPNERSITPLRHDEVNEGSISEVLPDHGRATRLPPYDVYTPPPGTAAGPHRIGRFELRRQLGKGGCGIVFLAYDPKLQRDVALKIPRPEMVTNPDAKSRLKREALAAAEFDHPNLVPVFEYGEVGSLCYIATAFCPGQTLAEWLDRQAFPVPVRQAARLVAIVAEAVQHAHDRGVLHRDLKPNNVILQEMKVEENDESPPGSVQLRGDYVVPRLVDFGLAKLLERGGPSETGTRQILGTPKYMAPEQAQARREDIGPQADVYALGVILYELLAGRAPYDGASDVEVLRQAVEGKPTPPRSLRPDLPRDLEAICQKAMARVTAERYRTAIDLADDLRRFLDGLPTVARPLRWPARAARWFRRNDQIVAIAVLAVTVVFVTGMGGVNWYQSRALIQKYDLDQSLRASRERAVKEWEYARRVREAASAWRGGSDAHAGAALDEAEKISRGLMEPPDFAYEYLRRLLKTPRVAMVCPAGPVTALAVSPDGSRIASGHADGTLAVWDRATQKQVGTVQAHAANVTHVAFALGGTRVFTVGKGKGRAPEALGWAVAAGGELSPAPGGHRVVGDSIHCLAVSPDGSAVYAGGEGGRVFKIHLADAKQNLTQICAKDGIPITRLAVSPSGRTVFTAARDGTVARWTPELTAHRDPAQNRAWGEVTALAATGDDRPAVGTASGHTFTGAADGDDAQFDAGARVYWIATAPNGRFVQNGTAGRILVDRRAELPTGDAGEVRAGAFSPDGRTLFTGSQDGILRAWNLEADLDTYGVRPAGRVTLLSIGRDGASFVIADDAGVRIHRPTGEGKPLGYGPRNPAALRILDEKTVRIVSLDGSNIELRDFPDSARARKERFAIPRNGKPTSVALVPEGTSFAVGDDSGHVRVWFVGGSIPDATLDTGTGQRVDRVELTHDARFVAARTPAGVGVWNVTDLASALSIPADEQAVFRFLPGERIATAGRDGVVRVWSVAGRGEMAFSGHVGRVTALGLSPDGRTLVSGSATGEVKFWDLRTGEEILSFRRHSTPVTVIEFAPNARLLVTGGDGQYAVWDARE